MLINTLVLQLLLGDDLTPFLFLYFSLYVVVFRLPGWLVHLVVLANLPRSWPSGRARLVSIAASPLIALPLLALGGLGPGWPASLVGPAVYGLVARFRTPPGGAVRKRPERAG